VKKLRVLHVPSLVLENGNSTTEAAKLKMEAGRLKSPNAHLKRALELANLDPETARLVADAFDKYFSRPRTGRWQGVNADRPALCYRRHENPKS